MSNRLPEVWQQRRHEVHRGRACQTASRQVRNGERRSLRPAIHWRYARDLCSARRDRPGALRWVAQEPNYSLELYGVEVAVQAGFGHIRAVWSTGSAGALRYRRPAASAAGAAEKGGREWER